MSWLKILMSLLFAVVGSIGAFAQQIDPPIEKLVIATRQVAPFAMKDADGKWNGIAIDLIREVASDLNPESEPEPALEFREMTLKGMLQAVENDEVDLAVAALTVNDDRERRMDFSHPFHTSGLGIATAPDRRNGWLSVLDRLFSITFLEVVASLFGMLLLSGVLMYLFERRHNKDHFGGGFWRGLGAGMWWSMVTLTTVGYGDKAPKTVVGRLIAVLWMLSGILIISSFTAAVTSTLTLGQLQSQITGPHDLTRVSVATVKDSTSESYLQSQHIRHQKFQELSEALSAVEAGEVKAVVYDAPLLRFEVFENYPSLHVLPITLLRQDYAIAMPSGSPLRERINRILLRVISRSAWEETLANYLGLD